MILVKIVLVKVKTLWKYLRVNGTTPEGLCYEAVMDEMVEGMEDRESYFLNFSDGMPMFGNDDVDYHSTRQHLTTLRKWLKKSVIVELKLCLITLVIPMIQIDIWEISKQCMVKIQSS